MKKLTDPTKHAHQNFSEWTDEFFAIAAKTGRDLIAHDNADLFALAMRGLSPLDALDALTVLPGGLYA